MASSHKAISRFRIRAATVLTLRQTVTYLIVGGFIWGTAALVGRVAAGLDRAVLLWPLLGVVPAAGVAAWLARKRVPSRRAVRALIDEHSRGGGLLMAEGEVELGSWARQIATVDSPQVRWRGRRSWLLLAVAAAFVSISFLIPQRYVSAGAGRLNIDRDLERVSEKIETLQDLQIISQAEAETITKQLEQVRSDASGADPVKTWEALDHLEASLAKAAAEAGESALAKTEQMTRTEALAEALRCEDGQLNESQRAEAMKELAKMAEEAAENGKLAEQLSEQLGQACKNGTLTAEQLAQLAEAMRQGKDGQLADLKSLCEAGLIDADILSQCEKLGQAGQFDELAELLGQMEDGQPCAGLVESWCLGNKPGKGGVNRGRGDAAMTWTDGTDPAGAKFKEVALPPGAVSSLRDSRLTGVSLADPTSAGGAASASGALTGAAGGGGSAHAVTILPRHRPAVQRYFEREQK